MATREQEKARAKRRYERQQAKALKRRASTRRTVRVAGVAAAVVAVVAGFVLVAKLAGRDAPAAAASSTTAASLAPGCTAPPAVPGTTSELSAPDAAAIAAVKGKQVTATVTTTCGDIVLDLDGAKAPTTVASFVQLARNGYWKDAPCHRLVTEGIFILQCGDPTGTGSGDPGYGFGVENAPKEGRFPRGSVAMARKSGDPNSNGSQFFIVDKETTLPTADGGYSLFGSVTKGMDIVDRIAAGGTGADGVAPKLPISFLSVTTETKD